MTYNEIIPLDKESNTSLIKVMGIGNLSSLAIFDDTDEVHLSEMQCKHFCILIIEHFKFNPNHLTLR